MAIKPAFQFDRAGLYMGLTVSHESPLEPGVFHVPALCTLTAPPGTYRPGDSPLSVGTFDPDWPDDKWPRWNSVSWELIVRPQAAKRVEQPPVDDRLARLQAFFDENPDVAELINMPVRT